MSGGIKRPAEPELYKLYTRADRSNSQPMVIETSNHEAWSRRSTLPKIPRLDSTAAPPPPPDGSLEQLEATQYSYSNDKFDQVNQERINKLSEADFDKDKLFPMDKNYPKKLLRLCTIGNCGVCHIELSSIKVATSHYQGKTHAKKTKNWNLETTQMKRGLPDTPLYCKYCDITLSSEVTAADHYRGKKHQAVMRNGLDNARDLGNGLYERSETAKEDKTGRFGIGLKFAGPGRSDGGGHQFRCAPCDVYASSQATLDAHLRGAKHRKICEDTTIEAAHTDDDAALPLSFGTSKGKSLPGYKKVIKVLPTDMEKRELMDRVLLVDLQCVQCQVTFEDVIEMIAHYQSKVHEPSKKEEKVFECKFCPAKLYDVEPSKKEEKVFECKFCPAKLYDVDNCISHLNEHIEFSRRQSRFLSDKLESVAQRQLT